MKSNGNMKEVKFEDNFVLINTHTKEEIPIKAVSLSLIESYDEHETYILYVDSGININTFNRSLRHNAGEIVSKSNLTFSGCIYENNCLVVNLIDALPIGIYDDRVEVQADFVQFGISDNSIKLSIVHEKNLETIRKTMPEYKY